MSTKSRKAKQPPKYYSATIAFTASGIQGTPITMTYTLDEIRESFTAFLMKPEFMDEFVAYNADDVAKDFITFLKRRYPPTDVETDV